MRHTPFFAELASLDDRDPAADAVSAGLVVLRLVDAWVEEGGAAVAADGWGVRSVQASIEQMSAGLPARAILSGVLDAVRESHCGDMRSISPRLMAYARSLDLDAKWELAADVYRTVIAHVHPAEESETAIAAHLRLAYCQRSIGALDDATVSYETASSLAERVDDMFGILRAQIGAAKIAIERGNIPRAESLLDDVISRASSREDLSDVHAMALQDRAGVAFRRGRYDSGVELAYAALELTHDPINRDRLLGDIALAFMRLGVRSAARDAYLIVEATAQEQYTRWNASINLMELAAREGAMPVFERYRRTLETLSFAPEQRAQFHLQTAEGYEALREYELAVHASHSARAIAAEYGFHQIAFQADALCQRITLGQVRERDADHAVEPSHDGTVRVIADSIGELRRLAVR